MNNHFNILQKQKKHLFLYICICIFFFKFIGCNPKNSNGIISIAFDVSQNVSVPLSSITDNLIKVDLETTGSSLLMDIGQIDFFENYIFVKDRSPLLYIFNMDGKFVRSIGKVGGGPGEYNKCTKFNLDKENGKILLLTNIGVLTYDIMGNFGGQILRGRNLPNGAILNEFLYDNDVFYTINTKLDNDEHYFYQDEFFSIYDSSWNLIDSNLMQRYTSGSLSMTSAMISNPIFKNDNDVFVFYPRAGGKHIDDTLFIVRNYKAHPFLNVKLNKEDGNQNIRHIYRTDRFVIVNYLTKEKDISKTYSSHCLYDIKMQKGFHVKNGFIDDFYNTGHVIISPMPQLNMFCYLHTHMKPDDLDEPNPTLYIGKLKK